MVSCLANLYAPGGASLPYFGRVRPLRRVTERPAGHAS